MGEYELSTPNHLKVVEGADNKGKDLDYESIRIW